MLILLIFYLFYFFIIIILIVKLYLLLIVETIKLFFFYICHSPAVWTSLAKMCVKTKRLDVAEICLGHMKDCRGLAILRSFGKDEELDARVACLAIHLGMYVSVYKFISIY